MGHAPVFIDGGVQLLWYVLVDYFLYMFLLLYERMERICGGLYMLRTEGTSQHVCENVSHYTHIHLYIMMWTHPVVGMHQNDKC